MRVSAIGEGAQFFVAQERRDLDPAVLPSLRRRCRSAAAARADLRLMVVAAAAFSALAPSQVKNNEPETSTVTRTARIIRVLPEINQLNDLVRNQADGSKIRLLRQ